MSATPWVKWFSGDFLNGVADLEADEGWVYVVALNLIYDRGGPIPFEPERLARRCRLRRNVVDRVVRQLVEAGKLTLVEGKLSNPKAERMLKGRLKASEDSSEAARIRWEKDKENKGGDDAVAMPPQCDRNAILEARSQKLDRVPPNPPRGEETKGLFESDFDAFWRAYPKKKAKPAAKAAFLKATKRADVAAIMQGLERAKLSRDWTKDDGQFVPHPATWLNGDRWADDVGATIHPFLAPEPAQAFDPWPDRARSWIIDDGWNSVDWGPAPNKPGCRMDPRYIREQEALGVKWSHGIRMVAE